MRFDSASYKAEGLTAAFEISGHKKAQRDARPLLRLGANSSHDQDSFPAKTRANLSYYPFAVFNKLRSLIWTELPLAVCTQNALKVAFVKHL
jgi:hypothetical protein